MVYPQRPREEPTATYEVRLRGTPPDSLAQQFTSMRVGRARAQTVLFRRVESPAELDSLLASLRSLGLCLAEVHELPWLLPPDTQSTEHAGELCPGPRNYEVRVDGELGNNLLRFLRWRHYRVPEQTSLCVDARPDHVLEFIARCSELGLGIERVRRVGAYR
jgi:hypothetical protein